MKVAAKITLGLSTAAVAVFGIYSALHLRQEAEDRRGATQRETVLLARSLQVSIENALRDRQSADIRETLERLEEVEPAVDIYVTSAGGLVSAGSTAAPDEFITTAMERARALPSPAVQFVPSDDPSRLIVALPLYDDNRALIGAVTVVRPLDELKRELAAGLRRALVSTGAVVVAITVLSFLLGSAYIGRPLGRLAGGMRRVREGDLSLALDENRRDEIGQVVAEFDAMVKELAEARRRLQEEATARRGVEHALQEADKLVTVGQLSAGLAHEIGSPLQILNGRARALQANPGDAVATARVAAILVEQSDRIARIVEQLLRFARRRTASVGPVDVVGSIRAVLELLEVEVGQRRLSVRLQVGPSLPVFRGDGDHLQQIALNLIRNAVAATDVGGAVNIRLESGHVASPDGGQVDSLRLIVTDTGRGIRAEHRDRLFQPFFTTNVETGGTGLGLSVVNTLVSDYGGTVRATSEEGKGSSFTVELPCPSESPSGQPWT